MQNKTFHNNKKKTILKIQNKKFKNKTIRLKIDHEK